MLKDEKLPFRVAFRKSCYIHIYFFKNFFENLRISPKGIIHNERIIEIKRALPLSIVRPKIAPAGVNTRKKTINKIRIVETVIKSLNPSRKFIIERLVLTLNE